MWIGLCTVQAKRSNGKNVCSGSTLGVQLLGTHSFQFFSDPGLSLDMSLMLFFVFPSSHHVPRRKSYTSCPSSLQLMSCTFWQSISARRAYQMRRKSNLQPCDPVPAVSGVGCSLPTAPGPAALSLFAQYRSQQTYPIKGKIINNLGFVGHTVSVATP